MCLYIFQINSLPASDISNELPPTGHTQELISILRNSQLNSLLPNPQTPFPSHFPKSNPNSYTPPESSSTLSPYTNYNPTSQLPTSHESPLSLNPTTELTHSTQASDSALLPPKASNHPFNLDLLLNYNQNNQKSLVSSLPQKTIPNSYQDPTQLLQSSLRPPITDELPSKTTPVITSTSDPMISPLPNLSQSPSRSSKLLSIQPLSLSTKVNEEILKLLSDSPATPSQEPFKNSYPNSVPTPNSALHTDTPSLIPPSSPDLPSITSTVSQEPPLSPTSPSPPLSANELLNVLIGSPTVVKELTSLLERFPAQNSNSSPSMIDDSTNQQPPDDKHSLEQ